MCYICRQDNVDDSSGKLPALVDGVLNAITYSRKEEVKAWEQEFVPCEHTLCLGQEESREIRSKGTAPGFLNT